MSARDREYIEGWTMAAQAINRGLLDCGRKQTEHDVRITVLDAQGTQRNASRLSRGYVAGLRAALGWAS